MPAGDPPQVAETSGTSRTTMSTALPGGERLRLFLGQLHRDADAGWFTIVGHRWFPFLSATRGVPSSDGMPLASMVRCPFGAGSLAGAHAPPSA